MTEAVPMRTRICIVALTVVLHGCAQQDSPLPIVGTLERDRIALIAEASERIIEIRVAEGDVVNQGDVLMQLDTARQDVEVRRARAQRDAAAQRLAELVRGPRSEEIRVAQARLKGARDNLAVQAREHRRIADLVERRLLAQSILDRAQNELETADAEVESLSASLEALVVGTTTEELGQAQARLDAADAAMQATEILADRMTIRAPRDGRVEAIPYRLGAQPRAGETVLSLLADEAPYARVYLPAALHAFVRAGVQAEVRIDGIAEPFAARVRYVASEAAFTPYYSQTERDRGRLSFLAEVTLLDAAAASLPSGVAVDVDFPELRE